MKPRTIALAMAIAMSLAAADGRAAVIRVGASADSACDADSISAALLVAALNGQDDEIRIARNQPYLNQYFHLVSFPGVVELAGGYDNCSDTTPSGTTEIVGRSFQPVLEVDGGTQSTVIARDLLLRVPAGGTVAAVQVEEAGRLFLERTEVRDGRSSGARVVGASAYLVVGEGSKITGASGTQGGGVYCDGATVAVLGEVAHNATPSGGGGIHATGGCDVALYRGAHIWSNSAVLGGGVYLDAGSSLEALGTLGSRSGALAGVDPLGVSAFDVLIGHNTAYEGGGIYATGADTTVYLENSWLAANKAYTRGGGLFVGDLAEAWMVRVTGNCAVPTACSLLAQNEVDDSYGAAVFAGSGGVVFLAATAVLHNRVASGVLQGSVLFAEDPGTLLRLESVLVHGSVGAETVVEADGGATAWVNFTTAGGNVHQVGGATLEAVSMALGDGSQGIINASIFWPSAGFSVSGGSQLLEADCVITQSTVGLPPAATYVTVVDPGYRDFAGGDLSPAPGSPAVDYCDDAHSTPIWSDLLARPRGHDHPLAPNGAPGVPGGVHDVGAYEQWELFADGFESGHTGGWTG